MRHDVDLTAAALAKVRGQGKKKLDELQDLIDRYLSGGPDLGRRRYWEARPIGACGSPRKHI
jgi:hypothetical protein